MKTFIIDIIIFALIMVIFLVGLPRQDDTVLMRDADIIVDRPTGGVRLYERINKLEDGSVTKTFSYSDQLQNSFGTVRWQVILTATFEEQDGVYVCTGADHETVIYNTLYYEKNVDIVTEGDTATCTIFIGQHLYGIPFGGKEYVISLTCAPDGTIS